MEYRGGFIVEGPEGRSILFIVEDAGTQKGVLVFPHGKQHCHMRTADPADFIRKRQLSTADTPPEAVRAVKGYLASQKLLDSVAPKIAKLVL